MANYTPKWRVKDLALSRNADTYAATWTVLSESVNTSNANCFTGVEAEFRLVVDDKTTLYATRSVEPSTHTASIELSAFGSKYARNKFYPNSGMTASAIAVRVRGFHKEGGTKHYGEWTDWQSQLFVLPVRPTLAWQFEYSESQRATLTITAEEEVTGFREWANTGFCVQATKRNGAVETLQSWTSFTRESGDGETITHTWRQGIASLVENIAVGESVTLTAKAYSRGIKGQSPDGDPVTKSIKIGPACIPVVSGVNIDSLVSGQAIRVPIKLAAFDDNVQLQRRIGAGDTWTDVGDSEHVQSSADGWTLYDTYGSFTVPQGTYVYYRVKAWSDTIPGRIIYSDELRADKLYKFNEAQETSEAEVADCGIVEVVMNGKGLARVVIWWAATGDRTGNELSWSNFAHAWRSNVAPETLDVTWEDPTPATGYAHTATVYLQGLEEAEEYYFRARTYSDGDAGTVRGPWSASSSGAWNSKPTAVDVTVPEMIARGSNLEVYWTIGSERPQTAYMIELENGWFSEKVTIEGKGSLCYRSIRPAKYGSWPAVNVTVSSGTGGEMRKSDTVTTAIIDKPSLSISVPSTCSSMPFTFTATTDTPDCDLLCTVSSKGIGEQVAGEAVWTQRVEPTWSGSYSATVSVPAGVRLIDGGRYKLSVIAVEPRMGLRSNERKASFTVNWQHKAVIASQSCKVSPKPEKRSARLGFTALSGMASTDVYDVYRRAGGAWELIAEGVSRTGSVEDRFAPFGDNRYRVVCRTDDGDEAEMEFGYSMPVKLMRIDWDREFLELPYNIEIDGSSKKGFESTARLDGSIVGKWDGSVEHTGSANSDIVKVDVDSLDLLASLANHAGACFVRYPNGDAFCANVDVGESRSYMSGGVAVSLSVTRVALVSEYRV